MQQIISDAPSEEQLEQRTLLTIWKHEPEMVVKSLGIYGGKSGRLGESRPHQRLIEFAKGGELPAAYSRANKAVRR
jgi:hypothetical protein